MRRGISSGLDRLVRSRWNFQRRPVASRYVTQGFPRVSPLSTAALSCRQTSRGRHCNPGIQGNYESPGGVRVENLFQQ